MWTGTRPIPTIAFIPVAVLIFGLSNSVVVFLVALGCFWPVLVQTEYGVRDVDPTHRAMACVYGIGSLGRLYRVVIPGALAFILTGVRLAASVGLVLAVSTQFIVVPGLGADALLAYQSGDTRLTYSLVLWMGALGLALNLVIRAVERRVLRWHPSMRAEVVAWGAEAAGTRSHWPGPYCWASSGASSPDC